jgi:hypothetical protein
MTDLNLNTFLKKVLLIDLLASGATTLMLLAAAGWLADPLGLQASFLRGTGFVLVPWVAFLAWIIWQQRVPNFVIWLVIATNTVWVIDSIALMFTGWVSPSALGVAFIITQAVAVGIFAELQFIAMRRSRQVVA